MTKQDSKIVIATRTKQDSFDGCKKLLEELVETNKGNITKIFIISDRRERDDEPQKIGKVDLKVIFDTNPTGPIVFNKVIDELRKDGKPKHLLVFSKEVELKNKDIDEMLKAIESGINNLIVVGYRLKDNVITEEEFKSFANGDYENNDVGIAYQVPWNTCALWNKKFVYGQGNKSLRFDKICENNQLGTLKVKVEGSIIETSYKGMEDGLAVAELVINNKNLKYKLFGKELPWNINLDDKRKLDHKIKLARKNVVLSTFINIKGYSIDVLRKAGH